MTTVATGFADDGPGGNGNRPNPIGRLSDDDLRTMETQKLIEHRERLETMQQVRALESLLGYDGFGGSDMYFRLLRDRFGDGEFVPPNQSSDRKGGQNRPIVLNETQLDVLRQQSRVLVRTNPYAMGLHENQINYIVGKGFAYTVKPRDLLGANGLPREVDEGTKSRVKDVQAWVDAWIARNRWSATARDPRTMQAIAQPREREAVGRTFKDGEALVRLHLLDDGDSAARFVEPVQVRNNGMSESEGWTYGMRHRTEPFVDVETIEEYSVRYWKADGAEETECVPADQIIHFKLQGDDAAIKRGVPLYSFGVFDALERALNLQETASKTARFRAGNAEYWQHETGTGPNMGAYGKTVPNAGGNGTHVEERMGPGPRIRRMGPGTTPVNPTAAGFAEYGIVAQGDLRGAGAAVSAPEHIVSGDASNNDYASIREGGTPFVLATSVSQEHFVTGCLAVIYRALKHSIESGKLPPDTMDLVELHAETAKDDSRQPLERAQEDQILVSIGVKSPQTAMRERGLDPEQMMREKSDWDAKYGNQGMGLDPNDPYKEEPPPKKPNTASTAVSESWEEDKHPRDAGKFASKPGAQGGDKAPSILDRAKATQAAIKDAGARFGQAAYDALPGPAQVAVAGAWSLAKAIEHHLEPLYTGGQAAALKVAEGWGLSPERVATIGRALAIADGVARWTTNIPVLHEAIHVLSHVGGPVAFLGAKAGYYVPVASLAFVAGAGGTLAAYKTIKAAREGIQRLMAKKGAALESQEQGADIAEALRAHDFAPWYEACLYAALDETGGDAAKAINLANRLFDEGEPA